MTSKDQLVDRAEDIADQVHCRNYIFQEVKAVTRPPVKCGMQGNSDV